MISQTDILLCVFTLLKVLAVDADLIATSPNSTTCTVGSTVTFKCRTTNPTQTIRWKFSSPSRDFPETIHTGPQLLGQFRDKFMADFDNRSRESILVLKSAELNDTGTFSCLEASNSKFRNEFWLTVVGTGSSTVGEKNDNIGNAAPVAEYVTPSNEHVITESNLRRAGSPPLVTNGDSFKTLTIGGIVGVLLVCGLIVVILIFVVMKLRHTAAVANSVNETVMSGVLQTARGHHHKHRRHHSVPGAAAESQPENVSDSITPPTGSSSSIDGHYSEIMESETPLGATADIDTDDLPMESAPHLYAGQYQVLDPAAVLQLSTRPPNVYFNLAHRSTLTGQR